MNFAPGKGRAALRRARVLMRRALVGDVVVETAEERARALRDTVDEIRAIERRHVEAVADQVLVEARRLDTERRVHIDEAVAVAVAHATAVAREHAEAASAHALEQAVLAGREHTEASATAAIEHAVTIAREHTEAAVRQGIVDAMREVGSSSAAISDLHERVRRLGASVTALGSGRAAAPRPSAAAAPLVDDPVSDDVYDALEQRFRGSEAAIAERQRVHVERLAATVAADEVVLDIGFGRGEFLRLLRERGLTSRGVETSQLLVDAARADGLDVVHGDALAYLRGLPDDSIGSIVSFQVVEHLPFPVLLDLLAEARRVIRPAGLFLAETPNGANLRVAASTFWLDPTHQRPMRPEFLEFLFELSGLTAIETILSEPDRRGELAAEGECDLAVSVQHLLSEVFGRQDLCVIGRVPLAEVEDLAAPMGDTAAKRSA
jgi:SAM-dependent methyltransferase